MLTEIGKFLRKLRIDNGEILKTMADKLCVSSSFLSAVENGKKRMPDHWLEFIKNTYDLSEAQYAKFKQAYIETQNSISIDLSKSPIPRKELAVSFARQFDNLDDEASEIIMKILNKGGV